MRSKRLPVWLGVSAVAAIGLYVAGAALSGSLSPLARRPLLDGVGPAIPYRWVDPPPLLENSNQSPTFGTFGLPLGPDGSAADVLATRDLQVTLVTVRAMIPARPGAQRATVAIDPLDPADHAPVPEGLAAAGNVYRIRAAYDPGGPVRRFGAEATAILVYPSLPTIHSEGHEMLFSPDGRSWETLASRDAPQLAQVEAVIDAPGYLLAAGRPKPPPAPDTGGGSSNTLLIVGIGALSVLLLGAGIFLRVRAARSSPGRGGR
ncbi:MAG: LPXTG cell wall anchor domain-containing protein [Actinomycetota bacterium]